MNDKIDTERPLVKYFILLIGPFMLGLSFLCIIGSFNGKYKKYIPLQKKAEYLLSLNCPDKKCITEGKIIFYDQVRGSYKSNLPPIYRYQYYFEVNGITYRNNNLLVFSEGYFFKGMRYYPGRNDSAYSPETIIYDPSNPDINLPLEYAKVLPEIPNPYAQYENIFILVIALVMNYATYFHKE
ncbi:hypothetical protein J3U68_07590 [Snodgrassella sp. B3882]|uniref:hypothetical protein n=1 Tax=Snodgrassella sp. B3882 TaxID=2818037 RepID=UPI00226A916A|nr:hypothetical protein [Snodgrassella sp. B3882]MCX8745268.1 hypothetical protein [Snodgrassella sp. B3882]